MSHCSRRFCTITSHPRNRILGPQKAHVYVYIHSRDFEPECAHWITIWSWRSRSIQTSVAFGTATARTVGIRSNQETDGEAFVIDVYKLSVDKISGHARTPSKCSWNNARYDLIFSRRNIRLSSTQRPPITKAKIENVLKRLNGLSLGNNKGNNKWDVVDDNESKRRTRLSELVPSNERCYILIQTTFQLSQGGRGKTTIPIRPDRQHPLHGNRGRGGRRHPERCPRIPGQ